MNKHIKTIFVLILILILSFWMAYADNNLFSFDNHEYYLNDTVNINLHLRDSNKIQLELVTPETVYRYLSPEPNIKFQPAYTGEYKIRLLGGENILAEESFRVYNRSSFQYFWLNKTVYAMNEPIRINFIENIPKNLRLEIISEQRSYHYLESLPQELWFTPKDPGPYIVKLFNGSRILQLYKFEIPIWENNTQGNFSFPQHELAKQLLKTPRLLRLKNSQGQTKFIIIDNKNVHENNGTFNVIFNPGLSNIDNIVLYNVDITEGFELGLEELSTIPATNVEQAFAVDPSGLNFIGGIISVRAKGHKLLKCKDWNFSNQVCEGSWKLVQEITPGSIYNITFNQTDPAYAEVGVASVNTRKPVYHPYETAEIILVVLDNQGHLVPNANIWLNITDPNGNTYSFTSEIIQTSIGIYEVKFYNTSTIKERT